MIMPPQALEVADHGRRGQRKNEICQSKEQKENDTLRDGHQRHHRADGAGKDGRSEEIQNGLGQQDAVISAEAGQQRPVDAGALAQTSTITVRNMAVLSASRAVRMGEAPLERRRAVGDSLPQMEEQTHNAAQDQGKHDPRYFPSGSWR